MTRLARRRFLQALAATAPVAAEAAQAPQKPPATTPTTPPPPPEAASPPPPRPAPPQVPTRDVNSPDPDLGSLYPFIEKQWAANRNELSFLNSRFADVEEWAAQVRPLIFHRLFYRPAPVDPAAKVLERVETADYVREKIEFNTTPDIRVAAYVHIPVKAPRPAPALLVLHDHGGFYYFGKEKITALENEHPVLVKFKDQYYGGRSIASELARQGFVTLTIDMYYWGERRLILDEDRRRGINDWSRNEAPEMISALNARASQYEQIVARSLFSSGMTWSGIWIWDDIRSLDYLASRPEVDAKRMGCCGLSFGGLRSGHMAALDPRIRAAVVVGWMTSFGPTLRKHIWNTVGLSKIIPGMYRDLDYPDFVSLAAPRPLMVIHGSRDGLFAPAGVRKAVDTLGGVYRKAGAPDRFRFIEFDGPHQFNREMQGEAFAWLKKWI